MLFKRLNNNKGFLNFALPFLASAGKAIAGSGIAQGIGKAINSDTAKNVAGAVGSAAKSGAFNSGSSQTTTRSAPQFAQAPDYPEAEGARKSWWEELQSYSGDPYYGAVQPDWSSIWENAQRKVQQYFWGSPTDPGVSDKIKANAARRGVAESPALDKMMTRMGATQGNILSDMAVKENQMKSELGERGRSMYLQSLAGLSGLKPSGTWYTPEVEQTSKKGGWLGGLFG